MELNTFIVTVFCLIDDRVADLGRLRARGPAPALFDSEVITIEVVGEFLGIYEDTELISLCEQDPASKIDPQPSYVASDITVALE